MGSFSLAMSSLHLLYFYCCYWTLAAMMRSYYYWYVAGQISNDWPDYHPRCRLLLRNMKFAGHNCACPDEAFFPGPAAKVADLLFASPPN